jgi:hypothetical protein
MGERARARVLSTTLFFVDVVGERRAQPYTGALRAHECC